MTQCAIVLLRKSLDVARFRQRATRPIDVRRVAFGKRVPCLALYADRGLSNAQSQQLHHIVGSKNATTGLAYVVYVAKLAMTVKHAVVGGMPIAQVVARRVSVASIHDFARLPRLILVAVEHQVVDEDTAERRDGARFHKRLQIRVELVDKRHPCGRNGGDNCA
eukprot:6180387-Pleurochrysis_carterae.AAC.1